jgi:hypothetical protein
MKYRMFGQAVTKYIIVLVCAMFWRYLTPPQDYNGAFCFKGGGGMFAEIFTIRNNKNCS